jgi:predicted transcriptional regulator of viral defense system
MVQNKALYSKSQGLKLLESAVKEFGPIFSIGQIKPFAKAQKLSDTSLRYLISALAHAGWIEILKRGTYLVKSPFYSEEVPVFAISAALVHPIAISHWSACAHHGFTTQNPIMVQASTPSKVVTPEMRKGKAHSPRGRAVWTISGQEYEFIHVDRNQFWGFDRIWVNSWQQIDITDRERTALDLIIRPDIFGGFSAAVEILENSIDLINIERLVAYALEHHTGSVIKRLGWILDNLGITERSIELLRKYPIKRYYLLDPNLEKGSINNSLWKINQNLKRP